MYCTSVLAGNRGGFRIGKISILESFRFDYSVQHLFFAHAPSFFMLKSHCQLGHGCEIMHEEYTILYLKAKEDRTSTNNESRRGSHIRSQIKSSLL